MNRLALFARRVRRKVLAHRRLLAGLTAAAAVAATLQAAAEPPPPVSLVLTAARDIPGGTVLGSTDLTVVGFDPASVPTGVVASATAIGRTTAAPVRAGEPITDVRLVSGSMLATHPGRVGAPVRIPDAVAVALLKVGDRVDVLAADPQGGAEATVVVADAPVIALPRGRNTTSAPMQGGLVVLAISDGAALSLAAMSVSHYLSIVINH